MADAIDLNPLTPRLTDADLARLETAGERVFGKAGMVLFDEGDQRIPLWVIVSGAVSITHSTPHGIADIRTLTERDFIGDIAVLTGTGAVAKATVSADSELIRVSTAALKKLLIGDSHLSDLIVSTMVARRTFMREGGFAGVTLIGTTYDRATFEIRDLFTKHQIPFVWLAPEEDPVVMEILAARGLTEDDLPVLIHSANEVVSKPSLGEIATCYGLNVLDEAEVHDVLVVGSGPAGLAAAVYAASEGLSVLVLDSQAAGGQAGTSSKIENYLGFPTGISGRELAERAAMQAQKFGAHLVSPVEAVSLDRSGVLHQLNLKDGRKVRGKSLVIASGARYQKLLIEGLDAYEGAGVYYGATAMEGMLCGGSEVTVVGGGNSAGQGAVFLASVAEHVHLVIRRPDLSETMSEYLIRRILDTPNITLHAESEIIGFEADGRRLTQLSLRRNRLGDVVSLQTPFLFLMIGANPCTGWLADSIALDDKGFAKTGASLSPRELVRGGWALERDPSPLETSRPRVYAVGDVRSGSVKRVASAVGEGSVVVHAIHRALADDLARATVI